MLTSVSMMLFKKPKKKNFVLKIQIKHILKS